MAANGLFAKKRKTIVREVTDFPAGIVDDGVFGHTIEGKKYVRTRGGSVTAEEAGIFADGTDQTARLNAVLANSRVKILEMHIEVGGVIVINGSVNGQGKTIKFREGTLLTGTNGAIGNFKIDAPDTMQIVHQGNNNFAFVPDQFARDYICPAWWGFKPGTGADMTAPLQKACNVAIYNTHTKKVMIAEAGQYVVNNLLLVNFSGGQAYPFTMSIVTPFASNAAGVQFYTNNGQAATMHIQTGHNIDFVNILFCGVAPYVYNIETASETDWGAGVRTNKISPHCFCNIDGLFVGVNSTITDPANQYPGLTSLYTNTAYGGSTNIRFLGCNFQNYFFGLAEGLSGCPNGEGVQIIGGYSAFIAYFWGAGQLQSRENVIRDVYFIFGYCFVTNRCGNDARGDIPSINNCNICLMRYLFDTAANFTFPRFTNGYSESIYSLGRHTGNTPVNFVNWNLTFVSNDVNGDFRGNSPVLGEFAGTLSFNGGSIQTQNYRVPMIFNARQIIIDGGCLMIGGPVMCASRNFYDRIKFGSCELIGNNGGSIPIEDGSINTVDEDDYVFNHRIFLSGSKLHTRVNRTYEATGRKMDRIPITPFIAITVNTTTCTATFNPSDNAIFKEGDVIVVDELIDDPSDIYVPASTYIGVVETAVAGEVKLRYVPKGVASGGYNAYIYRYPVYIPRTMGQVTAGQTLITNVLDADFGFTAGDRIKGTGIKPGTYVQSRNRPGGTITLSTPAIASGFMELYDQKSRATTTDEVFKLFGSDYRWYQVNGLVYFKGDEVKYLENQTARGLYCVQGGKIGSANQPGFYTDGDASTVRENVFQVQQKIETGGATTVAQIIKTTGSSARQIINNQPGSGTPNAGLTLQEGAVNKWSFVSLGGSALIFNEALGATAMSFDPASNKPTFPILSNSRKRALYTDENGTVSSFPMPFIRTVTGNTTITADDYTVVADSAGTIILALDPAATFTNRIVNIKRKGTGSVVIDPSGAELIDGAATASVRNQWDNMQIQSNGTEWFII